MHPLKFLLTDVFTVTFTIALMVSIGYVGGHSLAESIKIYALRPIKCLPNSIKKIPFFLNLFFSISSLSGGKIF